MTRQIRLRDRLLRRRRRHHRHRGAVPRLRRRTRWLVTGALLLVLLLLAVVAVLVGRTPESPVTEAPETVSCTRWGLDGVRVTTRDPGRPADRGLFGRDAFGPGAETTDRFGLDFEHAGVTSGYHVLAEGLDWSRPVGVVLHLHGDGAFEYDNPQYSLSCMAEVALRHNMLLVVPRTPDTDGEATWWEHRDRNAAWFRALMEERVLVDYDVDRSRTWLTGYSGGAQFISQELLADHVDLLPGGGAVMMAGGEAPERASAEPTRSQLRELRLRWDVGTADDGDDPRARFDALSAARAGHAWYERQGYDHARIRYREGVDHFQLPYARILDRVLTAAEADTDEEPDEVGAG
ncbi:hypothetical protein ACH9EU_17910 [Kocuria sp. M1R5S2]|uniref:hypothetical protein n=1 Tax=Kocuria rhizosphaerae TaxID=3376285 RepID=UPI0037901B5A